MINYSILINLNENKMTCSIFQDVRKALDSVDHTILLNKLYRYGFCDKIFKCLNSYFAERRICTKIDGKVSSSHFDDDHGVSQGSILGLLFLLCVNDLSCASKFETPFFADNANLHLCHTNINSLDPPFFY